MEVYPLFKQRVAIHLESLPNQLVEAEVRRWLNIRSAGRGGAMSIAVGGDGGVGGKGDIVVRYHLG